MTDQITVPRATWDAMREALNKLIKRDQRNTCQHEETHRGGAIWEICKGCGAKWADDRGGKPKWKDPSEWSEADAVLTAANAVSHPKATEPAEKYARNLCISMARKFYPEVTQFEPLDDLFGLLTQIDNMTTGLVRPQATEPAPSTYEPIGWADWQGNMVTEFRQWSDGSSDEIVVYRKLAAAPEAKQ